MGRKPDPARRERLLAAAASYLEQRRPRPRCRCGRSAQRSASHRGRCSTTSARRNGSWRRRSAPRPPSERRGASSPLQTPALRPAPPPVGAHDRSRRPPLPGAVLRGLRGCAARPDAVRGLPGVRRRRLARAARPAPRVGGHAGRRCARDGDGAARPAPRLHARPAGNRGPRARDRVYLSRLRELEAATSTRRQEPAVRGRATRDAQSTSDASRRGRRRS